MKDLMTRAFQRPPPKSGASQVGLVVKNPPSNAGELGSILGWEDPLEEETATHSSILVWEIPCTEEPGRLRSVE